MEHNGYRLLASAVLSDAFRDVRRSAAARQQAIDFVRSEGKLWCDWLRLDPTAVVDALQRHGRVDIERPRSRS